MDNFSSPPPRAKEPTCPLHGAISGLRWQDADNPNGLGLAESYPLSPRSGGEVPLVERQRTKAWMQQLSRGPIWQKVLPDGDSKRSVRLKNWRPRAKALYAWIFTSRLGHVEQANIQSVITLLAFMLTGRWPVASPATVQWLADTTQTSSQICTIKK